MEERRFDDEWRAWIRLNVARGCSKDGIFRILIDEGFPHEAIRNELDYEPPSLATALHLIHLPNATRLATTRADIYVVDEFLDARECDELAAIVRSRLRPSTITNTNEPDAHFRSSRTCDLTSSSDPGLAEEIDRRMCAYMGINPAYSEVLQGQHYDAGGEFKPHTDYFEADELQEFGGLQGQRTWTMMIYLNDTEQGGETRFVNLGVTIAPQRGRAVIWNNQYPGGGPNPDTIHHGMPVKAGCKTILTKWFRERGDGPIHMDESYRRIPVLTRLGFKKTRMPGDLWRNLRDFYHANAPHSIAESVVGYISGEGRSPSDLIPLTDALKDETHAALRPLMEEWAGRRLEPTAVYGIRRYNRHATLKMHRDRQETHIASAILNVAQEVEVDWPLEVADHFCRTHQVMLSPGELLLYEGGRLPHGRPTPLQGEAYANVFVHYRPK